MKKVEFERVKSTTSGYGAFKGGKYEFDGLEEIIKKRIVNGWNYLGYVPILTRGAGDIEIISLIFEKNEE